MVAVFREVRRVLRDDGTLWLNIGDSYACMQEGNVPQTKNLACQPPIMHGRVKNAGLKPKDLVGIPWMLAFALRADGWYLRQDIIWAKPNPMPESVTDRCTKSHEYIFLLTKSKHYFFDHWAIQEPSVMKPQNRNVKRASWPKGDAGRGEYCKPEGATNPEVRNKRDVWTIATQPYKDAHFATFPEALVTPCILAGSSAYGCCPQCGEPYRRVMRKTGQVQSTYRGSVFDKGKTAATHLGVQEGERTTQEHVGWEMECRCPALPSSPCSVLDPFCGSGTVGVVCKRLALNFTGIDLNRKYLQMAKRRIAGAK
jgi:DNA modification methylase